MRSPEEKRSDRVWMQRIAAAIVIPLLALGAIESALRLSEVGFATSLTTRCTLQGRPAACYNLFFPAPFFPPGMIKSPQLYAIPAEKPKNTFRIFVLGESAAMGDPDPAYGFSRYLEVMLSERYPAIKFEVVNTGSVAINSHVVLPIAKGLSKEKPDLFILYSGNNEVVGPYGPGTALTASGMSLPVIRGSIWFRGTRIGQVLTEWTSAKREWGGMEMFLDRQVPASSPMMPYVYANYEANLRDTIVAGRKAGARVIVATIATNLRDAAPFASKHRDGLSSSQLGAWEKFVSEGSALESSAAYREALGKYDEALLIDNTYAELEFRVARCLQALHRSEAYEHFSRARDLDTLRFRADSRINQMNRAVAKAEGAEIVDAEALFARSAPDGVPGSDLIYEHVHLTPEGNYLLARAMFLQIASKLAPPTGAEEVLSEGQCEQLLAFTRHDRTRLAQEMLERIQKAPFAGQLNHAEQVLRLSMKAEAAEDNPQWTADEYERAIRLRPEDRILRYNFGLFLFNFNRDAAAEQLRMSRAWDDLPVFAPDGTPL